MQKKHKKRSPRNNKKLYIICAAVIACVLLCVGVVIATQEEKGAPEIIKDTQKLETKDTEKNVVEDTKEPAQIPYPEFGHGTKFEFVRNEEPLPQSFVNPLTGLACESDLSNKRPAAVMINNIKVACPQEGVAQADILYECLAEGGITRLLMVATDYDSLGTVGSVRSSREYYIDFAKNHDAIYVHAGGSEEAYYQIQARSIDHLDGVRADPRTGRNVSGSVFFRDDARRRNMGYEHSLMTNGEKIGAGIQTMGYRNTINEGFKSPIQIVDPGFTVQLSGDAAENIKIKYNASHTAEFVYDANTKSYLRYQFNHQPHIDATTGEQLSFSNVLVLSLPHRDTGDSYGHLDITTTGSGEGYYFTGGKMIKINWSKASQDSPVSFTDEEGYPLVLNKGKTMINIASTGIFSAMSFN